MSKGTGCVSGNISLPQNSIYVFNSARRGYASSERRNLPIGLERVVSADEKRKKYVGLHSYSWQELSSNLHLRQSITSKQVEKQSGNIFK
jgi:hypothetical protein